MADDEKLEVEIVTPNRTAFEGEVCWMSVQTVDGLMEILPGHAPLVTALDVGLTKLCFENDLHYSMAVNGGIMQIAPGKVLILAGRAERPEEIDLEDVRGHLESVTEEIAGNAHLTRAHELTQKKLWAEARIDASKSHREAKKEG